jgi:subtilase family serine protease
MAMATAAAALLVVAPPRIASADSAHVVSASIVSAAAARRARLLPFAGWANPAQHVNLIVHVPLRNAAEAEGLAASQATPGSPLYHHWLTSEQFANRYAPLQSDMRNLAAALRSGGFNVNNVDAQFVYASAPAATVERFFGTRMGLVRSGGGLRVDARTPISLPAPLIKIGATVFGLNAVIRPHPVHVDRPGHFVSPQSRQDPAQINAGGFFPGELMEAYSEPSYTVGNGTGMKIAVVGASDSTDADNHGLWCAEGLGPGCATSGTTLAPYPVVNHFEGSGSIPPHTDNSSLEASLDAQMAGGTAPGAIIDQYAAAGDDDIFLAAYSHIVNTSHEDIITTSYSTCELDFVGDVPDLLALHQVFLQGNLAGQTFLFASGDAGAYGCSFEGNNSVSVSGYAADTSVTGVGGTTEFNVTSPGGPLNTVYGSESSHSDEADSFASGGGVSVIWRAPRYQNFIGISPIGGRQVPDVSMHMGGPTSPFTFDIIEYEGSLGGVVGTSCSTPEFAGTLADTATAIRTSQGLSGGFRYGNVNNFLYYEQAAGHAAAVFHQDIPGDNLVTFYNPTSPSQYGYNQVIGLGTPIMPGFAAALAYAGTYQAAGNLVTASNP